MTVLKPPRKPRPYQQHGLTALQNALRAVGDREGWLEGLGEVGAALKAWQADLMADLGGEETVSAQERAVVKLAVRTHLLIESVDRWLLEQPSLVNKSRRQLFPVVLQRQQLADALARYMIQLGLKRRARPVPSLQDYLKTRYGGGEAEADEKGEIKTFSPTLSSSSASSAPGDHHRGDDVSGKVPPGGASRPEDRGFP